jgi:hypothetical protein
LTVDVLLVSLGSTVGLRAADAELAGSLQRAGVTVKLVSATAPREWPTLALTDLGWALAARHAAVRSLEEESARAVIYSTTTASLLWPRPGAIRFDAPATGNRPGRHGVWQRPVERARLGAAPLLLPQSDGALGEVPEGIRARAQALIVPVAVEPFAGAHGPGGSEPRGSEPGGSEPGGSEPGGSEPGGREIDAITYAANPAKKGLDRVLGAWAAARRPGEELVVAGAAERELRNAGYGLPAEGVRVVGRLAGEQYRSLLARSRVFVCAPRREDYGLAQLEALIDGAQLVTTQAPGPYAALPIARKLDPRLVGEDLGAALRCALDEPRPDYAAAAANELVPFRRRAVDEIVAQRLVPALLPSR